MHAAFQIPYVYDYITKLCIRQAEIIRNHENENVRNIAQRETPHRKHKRLKLGGGQLYRLRMTNYRPDLSLKKAPHRDKAATFRKQLSDRKYYLVINLRMGSIPRHTDSLTVRCNVTSTY
jgi:hypothetical protein